MKVGYARVSTVDQNMDLQMDALKKEGCDPEYIYSEHISGVKTDRPKFQQCLKFLRSGDILVVWRLDRLSRSLKELITIADLLEERGVELVSIMDRFDTSTSMGKAMFNMIGVIAQLERDLISERTKAGLAAARARGRRGGAPRKHTRKQILAAVNMKWDTNRTHAEICEIFSMKHSTLHRYAQEIRKER